MKISVFLIVAVVLLLVLLGGLALVIVLLMNPKTRVVGVVLLSIGLLGLLLAALVVPFVKYRGASVTQMEHARLQQAQVAERALAEALRSRPQGRDIAGPETSPAPSPAPPQTAPPATPPSVPSDAPPATRAEDPFAPSGTNGEDKPGPATVEKKPITLLQALGKALGSAIGDHRKAKGERPSDLSGAALRSARSHPNAATTSPATSKPKPAGTDGKKRPAWVDAEDHWDGNAYVTCATAGPCDTRLECEEELPSALQNTLDHYVAVYLDPEAAGRVRLPVSFLLQQIDKNAENAGRWEETIQTSVGRMKQLHVLVRLDSKFNDRLKDEWNRMRVTERMWYLGTGLVAGLLLLSVAFGCMKADLATGGNCRKRLVAAAMMFSLAIAGGALLVTKAAAPAASAPRNAQQTALYESGPRSTSETIGGSGSGPLTPHEAFQRWGLLAFGGPALLLGIVGVALLFIKNRKARLAGLLLLGLVACGALLLMT